MDRNNEKPSPPIAEPQHTPLPQNPYSTGSVEYWLYQWISVSDTWLTAFRLAEAQKRTPGWDADNRTAAEHYILQRLIRDPQENGFWEKAKSLLWASFLGYMAPPIYQVAKSEKTTSTLRLGGPAGALALSGIIAWHKKIKSPWEILTGRKTSAPSLNQLKWEYLGWQDSFEDNHNKSFPIAPTGRRE